MITILDERKPWVMTYLIGPDVLDVVQRETIRIRRAAAKNRVKMISTYLRGEAQPANNRESLRNVHDHGMYSECEEILVLLARDHRILADRPNTAFGLPVSKVMLTIMPSQYDKAMQFDEDRHNDDSHAVQNMEIRR